MIEEEHDPFIASTVGCLGGGFSSLAQAELTKDLKDVIGTDVIRISTLPRKAEGDCILNNAEEGLEKLLECDFILYHMTMKVQIDLGKT